MKVILFANTDWYLYNFRRPLIKELIASGFDVVALVPKGAYFERLRREGIKCIEAPLNRRGYVGIADAISLIRLFLIYKRERPAAVHHFTMHAALFGMLCAKLARVPYRINAVTGLGYFFTGEDRQARLTSRLMRSLIRWLFSGNQTHVVLQNQVDYQFFEAHRIGFRSNLHLIRGSGIDANQYAPTERSAEAGPIRVLMASRLLVDKGVNEYIAATQSERFQGKPVEFLLAGDIDEGNPSSVKAAELEQWSQLPRLTCLGYIEDMPRLLLSVDIVVLPSYREGLPRSLLEAAASKIAIVTTDVPGCNEVVVHGFNGLLVPVQDSESLAAAIERLAEDPGLRKDMGERGRERVAELFGEQMVLEKTCAIYKTFKV